MLKRIVVLVMLLGYSSLYGFDIVKEIKESSYENNSLNIDRMKDYYLKHRKTLLDVKDTVISKSIEKHYGELTREECKYITSYYFMSKLDELYYQKTEEELDAIVNLDFGLYWGNYVCEYHIPPFEAEWIVDYLTTKIREE